MESTGDAWGCLPLCFQLVGVDLLASATERKQKRLRFPLDLAIFDLLRTKIGCARVLVWRLEYAPRSVWKQAPKV